MSIDARITRVDLTADGFGRVYLEDRPKNFPGGYEGCKGQPSLDFDDAPEEVTALNGLNVWGSDDALMLGERKIASRVGYTRIEFVPREEFLAAVKAYREKRKAKA